MNKYTENFTAISLDEQDKITIATNKLNCEPILICNLTNHPEDKHLFVVVGQYIEPHQIFGKAYCVWTANVSQNDASLFHGHYGVSFKKALQIVCDKTRDLNEEEN